jgi:hypothetical protein
MRNYTTEMINAIENDYPRIELLEFQFSTGNIYLTTCNHQIEDGGNSYLANHLVASAPRVSYEKDLRIINVSIQISGLDDTIGTILANNQRNRKVILKTAVLRPEDHVVLGILLSSYYLIDNFDQDVSTETNEFKLNMSSFLSDFDTTNGMRSTQSSHEVRYPNSTSFLNSKDVNKELQWGAD